MHVWRRDSFAACSHIKITWGAIRLWWRRRGYDCSTPCSGRLTARIKHDDATTVTQMPLKPQSEPPKVKERKKRWSSKSKTGCLTCR